MGQRIANMRNVFAKRRDRVLKEGENKKTIKNKRKHDHSVMVLFGEYVMYQCTKG